MMEKKDEMKVERKWISELESLVGTEVTICGWIHRIKRLKNVTFMIIKDKSGMVQCVFSPEMDAALEPSHESSVRLSGTVLKGENAYGHVELSVSECQILNRAEPNLPIHVNKADIDVPIETLLEHRVLGLRHPKEQAIFKIQSEITHGFSSYLRSEGFTEIHTPKLVKEGAEGGANVFKLDYFGETAYLAQSPQFYKQMMVISGMERVFEIGSVFRAEAHSTSRHLNEYVSLDIEMGFIQDEYELMVLETALLKFIIEHLGQKCKKELDLLEVELPMVPSTIPYLKLSEALVILKNQYGKTDLEGDLDPEGEKLICEYVRQTTGSDFVFLTHYPQSKRPMYTLPCGDTETHSFDLLFRGVEITTGGRRIHQYDALIQSMLRKGLDPSAYEAYLEAFRYGAPPHGGLAIGLERLTALLLGYSNVRRTSLFPRDGKRLVP